MSTRSQPSSDLLEAIASVACARRPALLNVHRHRLTREDLEDCYSQATLELLLAARRGRAFSGRRHIAHALDQRFLSRIQDRQRALAGRSPMLAALAASVPLACADLSDPRLDVERLFDARQRLRRVNEAAVCLTHDQRLVLASQLEELSASQVCACAGWTREKYRKVAQRARARLRALVERDCLRPSAERREPLSSR